MPDPDQPTRAVFKNDNGEIAEDVVQPGTAEGGGEAHEGAPVDPERILSTDRIEGEGADPRSPAPRTLPPG